jgi:hypothetical protein
MKSLGVLFLCLLAGCASTSAQNPGNRGPSAVQNDPCENPKLYLGSPDMCSQVRKQYNLSPNVVSQCMGRPDFTGVNALNCVNAVGIHNLSDEQFNLCMGGLHYTQSGTISCLDIAGKYKLSPATISACLTGVGTEEMSTLDSANTCLDIVGKGGLTIEYINGCKTYANGKAIKHNDSPSESDFVRCLSKSN